MNERNRYNKEAVIAEITKTAPADWSTADTMPNDISDLLAATPDAHRDTDVLPAVTDPDATPLPSEAAILRRPSTTKETPTVHPDATPLPGAYIYKKG